VGGMGLSAPCCVPAFFLEGQSGRELRIKQEGWERCEEGGRKGGR
jgi:hypothetical protein